MRENDSGQEPERTILSNTTNGGWSGYFMVTLIPLYLPFMRSPEVVSVGAKPLDLARWIEPDEHFKDYIDNKEHLFKQNPTRIFAELPESQAAQAELSNKLSTYLSDNPFYPEPLKVEIIPSAPANLWNCSLFVQDDLCLLEERGGHYLLTAASVCAPSDWDLREKIGKPIHEIHAPVPELNKKIGTQINHMMAKLSPISPIERFNWSLKDDPRLALFPDRKPLEPTDQLYLRVERQTLVRLPKTNAIAFTIRVYIYPLEELVKVAGAIESLKHAIENMSAEEAKYKSMINLYPRFRRFCKHHLASQRQPTT